MAIDDENGAGTVGSGEDVFRVTPELLLDYILEALDPLICAVWIEDAVMHDKVTIARGLLEAVARQLSEESRKRKKLEKLADTALDRAQQRAKLWHGQPKVKAMMRADHDSTKPVASFLVRQVGPELVFISCPEIPGLNVHGSTLAEALERLPQAFKAFDLALKDNPPMSDRAATTMPRSDEIVEHDPNLRFKLQIKDWPKHWPEEWKDEPNPASDRSDLDSH